jgi:lysophospholipase L1-like esterase
MEYRSAESLPMNVRRALKRILFSLVPLGVFLLLLEGALRVAPDLVAWERRETLKLAPGAQMYVVTMGDSVTAGANLNPGESWPDQLEALAHAEGLTGVDVVNVASNGHQYRDVEAFQVTSIAQVPKGAPVIATLLVGHNDLSFWPAASEILTNRKHDFSAPKEGFRILQVLQWGSGGDVSYTSPLPEAEAWISKQLAQVLAGVKAHGGTLYVLSYAVPNPTPVKPMTDAEKQDLELYRGCIHDMNRMTLHAASVLGARTVDLEYELPIPRNYDPDFWLDRVHYTAKGSKALAQFMLDRFQKDAALPAAETAH